MKVFRNEVWIPEKVEVERLLNKNKLNFKRLVVAYDTNEMKSAGYWKHMRGLGNSASTEFLYMAWLGKFPSDNLAKARPGASFCF